MSDLHLPETPDDDSAAAASAATVQEIYAALAPERLGEPDVGVRRPGIDDEVARRQVVHVLLVSHDGARWLPRTLEALAASDLPVASVTAVDTGSTDGSPELLAASPVVATTATLPRDTGFPAALAAASALVPYRPQAQPGDADVSGEADVTGDAEWLWIVHDDCAPQPDALRWLLSSAVEHDADVVGPKVLDWAGRRQLLELGLSITGSGRRHTGLEAHEFDQGQHDDRLDVLAVGTAGMLVRRSTWEQLGGLDPALTLFRDDVDFGWRARLAGHRVVVSPHAIVEHVAAASHGQRRIGATRERAPLVDRRNALHVLLANAGPWAFPFVLLRSLVGSLLRAIGFVLGKVPGVAHDEMVALVGALHPGRIRRARAWRRSQPRRGSVRGLRPSFGHQLRVAVDNAVGLLAGTGGGQDIPSARRRAAVVVTDEEEPEQESTEPDESRVIRAITRPGFLLVLALTVGTLIAARGLLGSGGLFGGALLPAPDGASDLWSSYLAGWHPVGLGSPTGAPAYLGPLTGVAALLLGSAPAAVTVLVLLAVPLAGATAWHAMRGVVRSRVVQLWAALTYALLLLGTGAVAAGRLGTCVAAVLAPPLARAVLRAVPADAAPRLAWSAGFLLAVTTAFAPVVWPITAVAAALVVLAQHRSLGSLARWVVLTLVPPMLLLPWSLQWLDRPELLVMEPGLTGRGAQLSDPDLAPWAPALLGSGGPGSLATGWLAALPLLALLVLLLRPGRGVGLGWVLALSGVAAGVATSRVAVSSPLAEGQAAGWPGPSVLLVGMGVLAAVAIGLGGYRVRLTAVTAAAALLAVGTTGVLAWHGATRGFGEPLQRADPTLLPVYVAEEAAGPDRIRTLVLEVTGADEERTIGYTLLREDSTRLGDAEVADPAGAELIAPVVGDLLAGRGTATAGALAAFGVRYVYAPQPADPTIVEALDGQAGLTRASSPEGGAVWRVEGTTARVRLLGADQPVDLPAGQAVPSEKTQVATDIDSPRASRVVLAELDDEGWRATLDGEPLERASEQGLLAFDLPSGSGSLVVEYRDPQRQRLLAVQGVAWLVVLLLMVPPLPRRRDELEEAER